MAGVSLDAGVEIVGKRLELLKEIDRRIERVGNLAEAKYRRVFTAMAEQGAQAIFVSDYAENFGYRRLIANLDTAFRLASIHALTGFVEVGA